MPALDPDVSIIHAQRADREGNVQIWGITGVQKEAVLAAKRSLVTVEEIVDELDPTPERGRAAELGRDRASREVPRRRASVLRARATTSATTPSTATWDAIARTASSVHAVDGEDACPRSDYDDRRDDDVIAAARALRDGAVCFVGIGLPLDRRQPGPPHARARPRAHLRVGRIGAKPTACRCRSATASWPRPPTPWSACPRSSTTGCSRAGSTSASSAPRRSTGSATSTRP